MNTSQLKIIAVITMTMAHLNSFSMSFPLWFNWIGRIAAPIFVFCTVQAFVHTNNRFLLLKRLYISSVICGTIGMIFNITNNFVGILFLLILLLFIVEKFKTNVKQGILLLLAFVGYQLIATVIILVISFTFNLQDNIGYFLISIFAVNLFEGGSGVWFLIMGIIIYLTLHKKALLAIVYFAYCGVYFILTASNVLNKISIYLENVGLDILANIYDMVRSMIGMGQGNVGNDIFLYNYQWMMVFAIPLFLLYNGEKGKSNRWFFYIYYPVHLVVFALIFK